jgi:glycosyltransferase involved in cell wall biosynthesis
LRIAIANSSSRIVGGIETYLDTIAPELARAGHRVALLCESDAPAGRAKVGLPAESPTWCVSQIGFAGALDALREWRPDVVSVNCPLQPGLEAAILDAAPAVFFAHNYWGTCISGEKSHKFPATRPCDRRFGPQCLLHYYPHRCGGLNPITMLARYQEQIRRQRLLHRYAMIVTASEHMRAEYLRHGFHSVRVVGLPVAPVPRADANISNTKRRDQASVPWRLLFAGRMTPLKGGQILLDALPHVAAALERPVHVIFAGDGPGRAKWQAEAKRLTSRHSALEIEFTGWIDQTRLASLLGESDLLVVPSVWPEPFGLIGPEAGLQGIPAAAFAVGGIPEWLTDGVNGYLAPADPPTSSGLADAIVKCLSDPTTHSRLRSGAIQISQRFTIGRRVSSLLDVFAEIATPRESVSAAS